jgi:hypothetical protein
MNWRLIEWGLPLGIFSWLFVQMWTETPAGSAARGRHDRKLRKRRDRPSSAQDEASEPTSVPDQGNPPSSQAPSP